MPPYSYKSIQKCVRGSGRGCGRRTVTRKVIIEGGSGYKQLNKTRKRLTRKEISHIKRGKFIPGLFKDLRP